MIRLGQLDCTSVSFLGGAGLGAGSRPFGSVRTGFCRNVHQKLVLVGGQREGCRDGLTDGWMGRGRGDSSEQLCVVLLEPSPPHWGSVICSRSLPLASLRKVRTSMASTAASPVLTLAAHIQLQPHHHQKYLEKNHS